MVCNDTYATAFADGARRITAELALVELSEQLSVPQDAPLFDDIQRSIRAGLVADRAFLVIGRALTRDGDPIRFMLDDDVAYRRPFLDEDFMSEEERGATISLMQGSCR